MLAKRLPLVLAFAGGSVASAALFGSSTGDSASAPATVAVRRTAPDVESAASLQASASEPAPALDRAPRRAPASGDSPSHAEVEKPRDEPATDEGSSVADVLARLEAAYREELAAVAAREPQAVEEAAVAPAATSVPEPVAAAPREPAPEAEPPKVVALREATPPGVLHVGDVTQNTVVGNVSQTEVVVVQQLALLQYLELVAPSPHARTRSHRHGTSGVATRRSHTFSLPLTNPDNPWGFDFPPTVLAK